MPRVLGGGELRIEGRLRLAGALIVMVFAIFLLRLFQLQIVQGDELRQRSESNSVRTVRLEPPRGEIVDREGRTLATTRPAWELQVLPHALQHPERTFEALGRLLEAEPGSLARKASGVRGAARYRPVTLSPDLDFERLARVETHRHALPGVLTQVRPRRHYVRGDLAAHLLGTIGEVRGDQLERDGFEGVRPGDVVGQTGLEARFEQHLRGRPGGRNVVVDAAGREVEVLDEISPVPGGKVVLALDLELQEAAERAFDDVPEGEPPKRGAAVALDVRTGDVLAFVSRPAFDPNDFAGGIDRATWRDLTEDPARPLRNRVTRNHYPPGSIHKAIVAAALLEEGVADSRTRTFCPGFFRHGGRRYRCWKRSGHGWVDLKRALKESCDVYFYTHGVELGIDRLARIAKSFGLGERTGIRLPGEVSGVVPSSRWKERHVGQIWFPGETVSASIGQGYNLYTPIQLAVAYAALANGGEVLRPRLVRRLETREGEVVERFPVEVRGRVAVAPEHLAAVREGLTAVVMEPRGTGARARVPGISVAGKTGTAQVVRLDHLEGMAEDEIPLRYRDHAWFGAFAPADAPEIAVAVFIEHGMHGSSAAAPVAQRILARYFADHPSVVAASGAEGD